MTIDKAVQEVLDLTDKLGSPEEMTKADYSEFLDSCLSG